MRTEPICIWTFKSERRRFANRSYTTCASVMANVRYWHLADIGAQGDNVCWKRKADVRRCAIDPELRLESGLANEGA
jgi:hypothetical protein